MTQYMEAVCVHLLLRRPELAETLLLPVLHSYDAKCGACESLQASYCLRYTCCRSLYFFSLKTLRAAVP